jgi:hypothetical protein
MKNIKSGKLGKKKSCWILVNETDGILADPRQFKTKEKAELAKRLLIEGFCQFGEYLSSDGRRLSPDEVVISIKPSL